MAKVSGAGEHTGCSVSGRILNASGQPCIKAFTVCPTRGVIHRGTWYPAQAAQVTVDGEGRWVAVLLPSSLVGEYRVVIDGERFNMTVPDAESAYFEAIARPAP